MSSQRHDGVSLTLPFASESAAVVRRALVNWMIQYGSDEDYVEDARQVVSELVGNAVRHANPLDPGVMLVGWCEADGSLDLTVSDGGARTIPRQRTVPPEAVDGRGLAIVAALAQRWWFEGDGTRNTVHALLPLARAPRLV
jgi:serine/threonine-protein kinase RsbW